MDGTIDDSFDENSNDYEEAEAKPGSIIETELANLSIDESAPRTNGVLVKNSH